MNKIIEELFSIIPTMFNYLFKNKWRKEENNLILIECYNQLNKLKDVLINKPYLVDTLKIDYLDKIKKQPHLKISNRKINLTYFNLYNELQIYNSLKLKNIAQNLIIQYYELIFKELYGDIVEGISYFYSDEGDQYELENYYQQVLFVRNIPFENLEIFTEKVLKKEYIIYEIKKHFDEIEGIYLNNKLVLLPIIIEPDHIDAVREKWLNNMYDEYINQYNEKSINFNKILVYVDILIDLLKNRIEINSKYFR
ncbi:hypothetical protein KFV08_02630 [Macrococcoides canis]|uniref:hypothetical protein n=1 Tax=Macrococcoides canis TaxID=1855823 RepID=UPI00207D3951|nr:hypothetical protein [Macrococcus canis]MCO4097052.1 hypothetical protein [Macrococcus canis]UTH09690.1 hypothetical protein KFV08_02630 [Macrococcus canis]